MSDKQKFKIKVSFDMPTTSFASLNVVYRRRVGYLATSCCISLLCIRESASYGNKFLLPNPVTVTTKWRPSYVASDDRTNTIEIHGLLSSMYYPLTAQL